MDLAKEFFELFQGSERAHGTYKIDETDVSEKVAGKALTLYQPPSVELWRDHLDGKKSLGVIPPIPADNEITFCRWACIDVDVYKGDIIGQMLQMVKSHGLPFLVTRSKSGGAHLMMFFSEPIKCADVIKKFNAIAKGLGQEGCEVFPKQTKLKEDEAGNWLNMPYFDYEVTTRYGVKDDGKPMTPEEYIERAKYLMISAEEFQQLKAPKLEIEFSDGPPCLEYFARHRITEGGRNNAVMQMGIYAQKKFGEAEYKQHTEDYNIKFVEPPLKAHELSDTVYKSLDRKAYQYMCDHPPMAQVCNRKTCLRRKYGIGGSAEEEFDQVMEMQDLKKLVYQLPNGIVIDKDPRWEVSVKGITLRLPDTTYLQQQSKFSKICIEKVEAYPPALTAARWGRIINDMLKNVETVYVPFELSPHSQTLEHLRNYLRQYAHAKQKNDMLRDNSALKKDGVYQFRLESLIDYIRESTSRSVDAQQIGEHLEAFNLNRAVTTATEEAGGKAISFAYWEIDNTILQMFESGVQTPSVEDTEVNF